MKRVLIIDDDDDLRRAMVRVLRSQFCITSCAGITAALRLYDAGESFDAVLCDMMLDDGTGKEFHARLRERSVDQSDRILFLTGLEPADQEGPFYRATRGRHLLKPITTKVLIAYLDMMAGDETPAAA